VCACRDRKSESQANIHFEKAAIMFNLGAIISQLALSVDRKTETGAKECSKFFQEAAGAYAHMRDHACLKIDAPRPIDLTFECATMLEKLMLAQAQECVLEKAAADAKSPALLARLSKQIGLFYDECSRLLTSKPLSDHFDRSWQVREQL
jgi:programmed cell death 6-interacting protein